MGTLLSSAHFLLAPLQQFARWLGQPAVQAPVRRHAMAPATRVVRARPVPALAARTARLRVVRVFEGPQPAAAAGRMVISGRMADVCAELERLAALETAAG